MSKTGRPAGVLGPLLALVLIAGMAFPAHASSIPSIPHAFTGQVYVADPPGLVPEGRLVEIFVDGDYRTETRVDSDGWYMVLVGGTRHDRGDTVSFKVSGRDAVPTYTYEPGEVTVHHLTVDKLPYELAMAAVPPEGGDATDDTEGSPYIKDDQVSISAQASAGYKFTGWTAPAGHFVDASAAQTVFIMPPEAVTVTANFEPLHQLNMAASPPEGGTALDLTGTGPYDVGDEVEIGAQANEGYRFTGWTAPAGQFADASSANTVFIMPPQDVTVTANFAPAYQLTLVADPEAGGEPRDLTDDAPYIEGAEVEIRGQAHPGYKFSSWTASAGHLADAEARTTIFTMPGEHATVTASYETADTYGLTLLASPEAGGTPADLTDEGPYFVDTVVIIDARPNPGYVFLHWTAPAGVLGNANSPTTTFTMPAETVEVTAHYEAIPYTLNVVAMPETMGTATDVTDASPYTVGDMVEILAEANEGYSFVNWTAPAGSFIDATSASTNFTMPAENVTVTANFAPLYQLNVLPSPAAGGTALDVTGESPYLAGAEVQIQAEANEGYSFVNWTAPAGSFASSTSENTTFTMPPQAVTVTANFREDTTDTYTVSVQAQPLWGGQVAADMAEAAEGETVTVQVNNDAPGYTFTHWTSQPEVQFGHAYARSTSFTMPDSNIVITGHFAQATDPAITPCFIATAAYGTPSAAEIDVLREFRDTVLLRSAAGSAFVDLYYALSPAVAEVISESGLMRTAVREFLVDPAVWLVEATGGIWRK